MAESLSFHLHIRTETRCRFVDGFNANLVGVGPLTDAPCSLIKLTVVNDANQMCTLFFGLFLSVQACIQVIKK